MGLGRSQWLETGPVVTCHFSRLWTPEHVPRTSARAHTCTAAFTRASCVPRNREHENGPRAEEQKIPMCKKSLPGTW